VILHNATLLTSWDSEPVVEGALVAIEGRTIVDFGKMGKLIDKYDDPETLDLGGRVVMPGLVNAHAHLYSSLARGMPRKGIPAQNFREILERVWWRLDRSLTEEDVYMSALVGLLDSVRAGVTTVVDHHSSPGACSGSLDAVWRAFAMVGVRGCLAYEVSDRDGEEAASAAIDENARFIERCRATRSEMMAALFGLHASFTLSDKTLSRAVEVGRGLGAGFHVHVAEDRCDVEDAREKYGKTPVERLVDAGALEGGSIAAHCVHVSDEDVERLRRVKARVVHNPQSNAANAVGTADLMRLSEAEVPLGMGTDGFSPGVFEELRAATLHQRIRASDPRLALDEAYRMTLHGNADLATSLFGSPVGRIKPGARADLVVLNYRPATPLDRDNVVGHVSFGVSRAAVDLVIVNGKILYRDGTFPGLDEERVRARAKERAAALWERM